MSESSPFAILLMGSASDRPHADQIAAALVELGIPCEQRIASAHKTPQRLLRLIEAYEADPRPHVYITIAGRSNALSGMVDANVHAPVIACPPISNAFGGADLLSSIRMPSGVAPLLVLEPANAALAAAKILSLASPELKAKVSGLQQKNMEALEAADAEINDVHRTS